MAFGVPIFSEGFGLVTRRSNNFGIKHEKNEITNQKKSILKKCSNRESGGIFSIENKQYLTNSIRGRRGKMSQLYSLKGRVAIKGRKIQLLPQKI